MSTKLHDIKRKLIVDELRALLDRLKSYRSLQVTEGDETSRSAAIAQRVELARGRLEDLRAVQRKDKAVQAHHRKIAQDNAKRG